MLSRVAFLLITLFWVTMNVLKDRSLARMRVFVSTHQLSVAEEMADRIGIIHGGRLVAVGTREELRRQSGATGPLEKTFLALTAQEANLFEEQSQPGLAGVLP